MVKNLFLFFFIGSFWCHSQVKPEFLYNTTLPYGTLDLRTKISSSDYYYLQEGVTFSFRESAAGVRTNTFAKVTNWDSSPYGEGNMRKKSAMKDEFVMNYRLLKPLNYDPNFQDGYPLIVIMHGAVERGNCYYDDCYHADWNYNPNENIPPAPTNPDHRLLNNDYHLTQSAKEHLAARNLAGTKLPNDSTLSAKAFPGFVLMPQMLNVWDSLTVQDMIKVVLLHLEKYKINPDKVYIHGLSIGGYATYEAIKRAPWLFAAALPMSAVTEAANIFKHNQQNKVAHIPIWTFQGGLDDDPSPAFTQLTVDKFKAAGASIQLTVYPDLAHRVWGRAYQEANFFKWILSKRKNQIRPLHGVTQIDVDKNIFPKLVLPEGFFAYQWEKNGVLLTAETTHQLKPTAPGIYRARFTRKPTPSSSDWNSWSEPVTITIVPTTTPPPSTPPAPPATPPTPPSTPPTPPAPPPTPPAPPPTPTQEPSPPSNQPPAGNGGSTPTPGSGTTDPNLSGDGEDDIEGEDNVTAIENDPTVSVSLFPNPTNTNNIAFAITGMPVDYTISIIDMLGSLRYQGVFSKRNELNKIDNVQLTYGIYNVIVSGGSLHIVRRLVIHQEGK